MKLKHIITIVLTAAVSLVAFSCAKPEENNDKKEDDKKPEVVEGKITVADDALSVGLAFAAQPDPLDLEFAATLDWTAKASENWLTITPASGKAGDKIKVTVTATENTDPDSRKANIVLTCDKSTVTVPVVQLQKNAMVLAPETINVPAEGLSNEIKIMSNVAIEATPDVDWITVAETKALTEKAFTVVVAANETYDERTGHVEFESAAGSQTITFVQAGAEKPQDPPVENSFTDDIPALTGTTTWEGAVFDAIIDAKAAGQTEWQSPDGENFIDSSLGYLAGYTESVDESTGQPKTTYGKFKFKKDENAGIGKMSRVQLGGTGVIGKRTNLIFRVSGPGSVTVIGRSSGDAARKLVVALNGSPVSEEGYEMPGKADNAKTVSVKVEAQEGDLVYVYSMESGINLYSIKWTPAGGDVPGDDPGDEPGDNPTPGESADLTCPAPPTVGTVDPTEMTGYAAAKGVTGGAGAGSKTYHFDNGKALQTWLLQRTKDEKKGDHTPVTIWLSGTFTDTDGRDFSSGHPWFDVKDVSNLSFIGTDSFVMDRIGIFCVRANNIIIRNINFQQPKANNGADAVSMQECDGVWVDHCTFTSLNQTKDYEDGSTDVTHGSKNVTVSWCRYIKTQKSCLVGHSNSQSSDTQISVTFHHNWFDQSSSRHPRVRFGKAHVYNNLYDGCTTYGAGSAYGAMVLVEYNYFNGVQLPTDICTYPAKESGESNLQGSVAGYLYPTENIYVNRPEKAKDPYPLSNVQYTKYNGSTITPLTYADFKPAYDYTVTAAEDVPALVKANAGYGKMTGFAEAPIPVDNAGINDFNGTDDDPVDPDQGDEDDPVGPTQPETGSHVHVVYYNSSSEKTILTDGAPSTYFEATAKTDLSNYAVKSWELEGYSSNRGIKMNSSGYVKFKTSATLNSTVRFYSLQKSAGSAQLQLIPSEGEALKFTSGYDTIGDSGVVALEKGMEYTIKQVSSEQALLLVVVRETE